MAALEDFENTLKEVVGGKRLSASKMNRLTEIAMKSLEDDTKLVAILYRTHNSLPSSAKVSSLYAFDALARAARGFVNKRGATGDANSAKGNATTFLLKIEGVLDGLFRDMVSLNNSEAKEKTKKVHDIWVKSNTFPPAVLARLGDVLTDVQKAIFAGTLASNEMRVSTETSFGFPFPLEFIVNPTPPSNPPITTPPPALPISDPVPDVQATLLALLGQAAQSQSQPASQTPPNMDPQLQPQLALLQQLALTAKLANGSTSPPRQTPPIDKNLPPSITPVQEPSSRPPPTSRFDIAEDPRYARNGNTDRTRDPRESRDERPMRGGFRGRGRWDDQGRFRPRDRDWNPPPRPRRSRSRSPRRHEERRNVRPYSPPRRPLNDRDMGHHQAELPAPPVSAHGKDEFGRDIRASSASPSRSTSVEDTQALAPMDSSVDPTAGATPDNRIPVSEQSPLVAASMTAQSTETHTPSAASQQQPGLDQFDINAFDATAPSSWEALGNMWQTNHGYQPSQEELMHFVMVKTMATAGVAKGGVIEAQGGQWQQGNREEQGSGHNGGWKGPSRGSHGGVHGNYRNGLGGAHTNVAEQSNAMVLDEDEGPSIMGQQEQQEDTGRGGGGRMQRVGDKWMFVKESA